MINRSNVLLKKMRNLLEIATDHNDEGTVALFQRHDWRNRKTSLDAKTIFKLREKIKKETGAAISPRPHVYFLEAPLHQSADL